MGLPAQKVDGPKSLAVPHFVGIGAPRCGTTWAFKMLRLHPQVWMPWKEVHYFDSIDPDTDSGHDIRSRRSRLRAGWQPALLRLAASSIPGAARAVRRVSPLRAVQAPGYRWTARYFLGKANQAWYEGLFREGLAAGLRCGEITPAYVMLSPAAIARFSAVLPDVRAFLMLRHPVEWAWSDLCKKLRLEGRNPADVPEDELIARCPVPAGRSRADFGSNLARWLDHFPRERLFIGFHEQIRAEPAALLDRLCRFIGVDSFPQELLGLLAERVNSSARGTAIPPAVRRHAAHAYYREARLLAGLVGGESVGWLKDIEQAQP